MACDKGRSGQHDVILPAGGSGGGLVGGMEALHNVAVLDIFFAGVQHVLSERPEQFAEEITRFEKT
jgi:hypothetical protein